MIAEPIAPAVALAYLDPRHIDDLSDAEAVAAAFSLDAWLRPEQRVPPGAWRSFGVVCGRGWGKTTGIAAEINRRVESGECRAPALLAPSADRTRDVQVKMLIETAHPAFRPTPYREGVTWPNGVYAEAFTAYEPDRPRSSNFDLAWMTEIVDWQSSTALDAFQTLTTATRLGRRPQYLWDTTSKGKNAVILQLLADHAADPRLHLLRRGTMFDNLLFTDAYLATQVQQYVPGSRRFAEEVLGQVFAESAGALWQQAYIDDHRVTTAPRLSRIVIGLDVALSDRLDADETGLVVGGDDTSGVVYLLDDHSGRMAPEAWANRFVDLCASGAAGGVIERNAGGDTIRELLRVHARARGMRVDLLPDPERPFPPRREGVIYLREVVSRVGKGDRAAPAAALAARGRVHHVGTFPELELEMTTWEPGGKSPNRLDAAVFVISELAGVRQADRPAQATPADVDAARTRLRELLAAPPAVGSRRPGVGGLSVRRQNLRGL